VFDHAKTFSIGSINAEKKKLMNITEECLYKGIEEAKIGNTIGDIGYSIQNHAESHGFSIVRELVGHGIGRKLHEEPQVPNFGIRGNGVSIKPGLCLAIEPMINMGSYEVYTKEDNWTVCTKDGKPSAHFEHSIAVTENGIKILSK
jgi:methionyl aminopeptidase